MTPPHFGLDECHGAPVGFGSNAPMYVTKGLGWWYGWSIQVTDAGVWYGVNGKVIRVVGTGGWHLALGMLVFRR